VKALALKALGALMFLSAVALWLSRAPDWPVETLVARWAPPPSQFIDLNGQLVHLRDDGARSDATPLVLLHGSASSLHTWEAWVKALRARHRVITVDLPGFGLTGPNASGDYAVASDARFVLDLLDRLQVPRFAIGGHALGGEVAWRVAQLAPERVSRLILVDAGGPALAADAAPIGSWIARLPLLDRLFDRVLPRPIVVAGLHNAYGDPARVGDALVERTQAMLLREGNRAALVQRLRQRSRDDDAQPGLGLKLPTLILWGGRDRLLPVDGAHRVQAAIDGSRLLVFDDLGHVPHEEDPARTVSPVMAFLAGP
jgi:pimeloyl-ACP methyl ester carboxylesterase